MADGPAEAAAFAERVNERLERLGGASFAGLLDLLASVSGKRDTCHGSHRGASRAARTIWRRTRRVPRMRRTLLTPPLHATPPMMTASRRSKGTTMTTTTTTTTMTTTGKMVTPTTSSTRIRWPRRWQWWRLRRATPARRAPPPYPQ